MTSHRRSAATSASESVATGLASLGIRRAASIFDIDGGWFRARWHFSFDEYHDPDNMGIGTLRVFNHDTLIPGAVWPMHPHRDIEGITDRLIVVDERHLRAILAEFVRLYNARRPHRTLGLEASNQASRPSTGPIRSRAVLGGLHHTYQRAA